MNRNRRQSRVDFAEESESYSRRSEDAWILGNDQIHIYYNSIEEDRRSDFEDVHVYEGASSQNENVTMEETGPDGSDVERISTRDRSVYFATVLAYKGLTTNDIDRFVNLVEVACGQESRVKKSDIEQILAECHRSNQVSTMYLCAGCQSYLTGANVFCSNSHCPLVGVKPKRSKRLRRHSVSLINIRDQLKLVLDDNLDVIIEKHRALHYGQNSRFLDAADFALYKSKMETREEFERKHINVLLTISLDGFVARRLSRQQLWPLYLRLEALPNSLKNHHLNVILAAVMRTFVTPSEKMFEVFYSRLISEMNILDAERFCMTVNGEEWSVHIKIGFGILDFGAMKDTFGIPRWTSEFGCHLCKFRGNREGSFHVNWYCEEPLAVPLRDRQSILSDACLSRNGLNGRRTAMHLITPESCPPDALHLISEGLTKDRIRDLVCDSSTMSDMKLHRSDREDLKEALHGIVNYCYSNAFILGLEDLSVMTGSERDALANVLFPVVGAEQLCPKIQASAAIVGYWMVVRAMQMRDVTPDTVDILQRIAGNLKTVLGRISKKMFTLKQHVFLDHVLLRDLLVVGDPYIWSAGPFESLHKRLQCPIDQNSGNSDTKALSRFLILQKLLREVLRIYRRTNDETFMKLYHHVTNDNSRFMFRFSSTNFKLNGTEFKKLMYLDNSTVNILFTEVKELQKDIRMLRMQLSRPHSEIVPEGVQFSYDNVKNEKWVLYAAHPFQNTDLVKHLMEYVPSKRIKHKIYLVIVDFFRKVLKRMCCPPEAIQDYAVRQLGGGKKREISDLPGNILDFLIRFGVAAIGLGAKELENGEIESLRGTSNSFWLRLGPDEIMREAKYNFLMMEKQKWMINTRKAIADALDDLRSYTLQNGELIPPKKISKSNSNYNFYGGQHVHESNSNIEVHTPEMVYEEL